MTRLLRDGHECPARNDSPLAKARPKLSPAGVARRLLFVGRRVYNRGMKPYNDFFLGRQIGSEDDECRYIAPLDYAKSIVQKECLSKCPLCGADNYIVVGVFEIDKVIDSWVRKYGVNPIADIYRHDRLEKRRCQNCGLYFYNRRLPDAEELYRALGGCGGYYPPFRTVHGIATEVIESVRPKSLLEIGCGTGGFLSRVKNIVPRVRGSEYNSDAAAVAREIGLDIFDGRIEDMRETFHMICHFEVMEHVFDTKDFMDKTIRLLRPGGKLIIGAPDPEGILSVAGQGPLHLPPHHQFDFSEQTFRWLADEFGLGIADYKKTELEYRHYAQYVKVITGIDLVAPDMPGFFEAQKRYSGHSHVVVFERDGGSPQPKV